MENLVSDVRQCAMPYTCPHGRPTIIEMNYRELEKKFGLTQYLLPVDDCCDQRTGVGVWSMNVWSAWFLAILIGCGAFGCSKTPHSIPPPAAGTPRGILKSGFIYETAPFPSCHASTLVETKEGLVAAWFGGTREGNVDVGIWSARLEGGRWTPPVEVANGMQTNASAGTPARFPCWNPVLFQPTDGPLLLFYKVGPHPRQWWGLLRTSDDGGKSWSAPRTLRDGILGPIKNKPVQLSTGEILSPTSSEHDGWRVHFERSGDGGLTWSKTGAVNDGKTISAIQPSVLLLGGEKLMALGRTRQGKIFQINSDDAGQSWGAMKLTGLPNPNSGIDAVTLRDGRHLLIYNHTASGRSPLNLAVSRDGQTWQAALVLENEPQAEFSYPAIIQTSDGLVHVTYTWKRQKVKHVVIDPSKLVLTPVVNGAWPN